MVGSILGGQICNKYGRKVVSDQTLLSRVSGSNTKFPGHRSSWVVFRPFLANVRSGALLFRDLRFPRSGRRRRRSVVRGLSTLRVGTGRRVSARHADLGVPALPDLWHLRGLRDALHRRPDV